MPYRAKADFDAYTGNAKRTYQPLVDCQTTDPCDFIDGQPVDMIEIGIQFYLDHPYGLLIQRTCSGIKRLPEAEKIIGGALIQPLSLADGLDIAEVVEANKAPVMAPHIWIVSPSARQSIESSLKRSAGHWKDYGEETISWWPTLKRLPYDDRALIAFAEVLCEDVYNFFEGTEFTQEDPADALHEHYNPMNPNADWWGYGRLLYLEVPRHKIPPWNPDTNAIETDPEKFCDFLHFHLDERAELRIADGDCDRLFPISNGPITYESAMEQIGAFIKAAIPKRSPKYTH